MEKKKPTLVLLPGLDGTGLLFERVLSALPSNIRAYVFSYQKNVRMSLEEYCTAVKERIPTGPVILLAESFSGLVALRLLRERQIQVERVILVATFGSSPRRYLKLFIPLFPVLARFIWLIPNMFWRFFCLGASANVADIAWIKRSLAQVDPSVIAHRLTLAASAEIPDGPKIDISAYYIQALEDLLVPSSAAEQMRNLFSRFTLLRVPGPHFLLQSKPVECARIIADVVVRGRL